MTNVIDFQKAKDTAAALQAVVALGRSYAKIIMREALLDDAVEALDRGIEAAVTDTRNLLETNGICKHDVDIALTALRSAIVAEGKAIAFAIPDVGETVQ